MVRPLSSIIGVACFFLIATGDAATPEQIATAKTCVVTDQISRADNAAGAELHRKGVQCLKDLYVAIAVPKHERAVKNEIYKRLDALEKAFYASRDICGIHNEQLNRTKACGTKGLAGNEFRRLLKTMIVNEDAGWVKEDPRLKRALGLEP